MSGVRLGTFLAIASLLAGCDWGDVRAFATPKSEREYVVELPTASDAKPLMVQPREVFVQIDQRGGYATAGIEVTLDQLRELLTAEQKGAEQLAVVIRADERCQLSNVVALINVCNEVGVSHSLTTIPLENHSDEPPAESAESE